MDQYVNSTEYGFWADVDLDGDVDLLGVRWIQYAPDPGTVGVRLFVNQGPGPSSGAISVFDSTNITFTGLELTPVGSEPEITAQV